MRATVTLIASIHLTLLLAAPALAQPHTVLPGESIQQAIDAAANGDTVLVEAGRYNESINLRGKRVTLRSIRGPHVTFLDGDGLAAPVLRCVSGETLQTIVDGFTITNGAGAAEYTPSRGGGLLVRCSSPTIRNCIFQGNTAADFGGGAYVIGETLALDPCTAGAVFEDCTFRHNVAGRGAGLSTYFADTRIERCAFHGNRAGTEGGGLRINGGATTAVNAEFVGNIANRGGALFLANTSPEPASASIVGCTITANIARITRGGLQVDIPITLANTIIHANTAPQVFSFDPATTTVRHCLIEGGFPGTANITGNPLFRRAPSTGPDGEWTTADDDFGDLRLQPGSPCLDRADSAAAIAAGAATDAHDCPRDVNDPAAPDAGAGASPTIDLGAHERRPPIIVDNTSIQQAINAAEPCDEVILRPGTYNESIDFLGKSITVRGESTPDQTILSGAGLSGSIVRFVTGETPDARLENITIRGGHAACQGGGIRIEQASPTIANCRITDNAAACPMADNWGGGLFIRGGAPRLINCEIDNNFVGSGDHSGATFGAGLYAEETALHIVATTFHDNITDNFFGAFDQGGGICHFGPLLVLDDCTFLRNRIDSNGPNEGGGAYTDAAYLEATNCRFIDNFAGENAGALGGGLRHSGEMALIQHCQFTDNHVGSLGGGAGIGGGLFIENGLVEQTSFTGNTATLTPSGSGGGAAARDASFNQCLFENNLVTGDAMGGGLLILGDVHVVDTTFRNNQAAGPGGAIAVDDGDATILASTFQSNVLFDYPGGGAIALRSGALSVSSSHFLNNDGGAEGGAIRLSAGTAQITNTGFLSNRASRGGAIYNAGAACTLATCTFTLNIGCGAALWTAPSTTIQDSLFDRNFPDHIQGPFNNLGGNEGLPYADLDRDADLDVFDLLAYLDLWFNNHTSVEHLLAYLTCWFSADPLACPAHPSTCD